VFAIGSLPKGYGQITRSLRNFRIALEEDLLRVGQRIGIREESLIVSAVRAEQACRLSQKYLRDNESELNTTEKLSLAQGILKSSTERDRIIGQLLSLGEISSVGGTAAGGADSHSLYRELYDPAQVGRESVQGP
jgi:hypothetical protein